MDKDRGTAGVIGHDLQGLLLHTWGTLVFPGDVWGVHGMSVDREGHVYVAESATAASRSIPVHARAELLVGKPVYAAWE